MRVLAITNMYPTAQFPALGTFVEQQINSLTAIGIEVDIIFLDRVQKGMGIYYGLGRKVSSRIQEFHPDLVHIMYGGIMADLVTRVVKNRPVVVSLCGSDLLGELLSGYVRKLIAGYGVLASYKAARRANGVIVKSKNLRDALPIDIDQSKIRIIPNGVDLARFKPLSRTVCRNQLGWRTTDFHILFPMNSGDPRKRPELARAAVEILKRSGILVEMHLLQGIPHQEVPIWLNACDVVLLTSLHEGSPNVIKEALACNVPIVSVNVGDVRERIEGIDGCYITSPEPINLAAKLKAVYAGLRRVAGRTKMEELSLERVSLRLKEFYFEILMDYTRGYLPDKST